MKPFRKIAAVILLLALCGAVGSGRKLETVLHADSKDFTHTVVTATSRPVTAQSCWTDFRPARSTHSVVLGRNWGGGQSRFKCEEGVSGRMRQWQKSIENSAASIQPAAKSWMWWRLKLPVLLLSRPFARMGKASSSTRARATTTSFALTAVPGTESRPEAVKGRPPGTLFSKRQRNSRNSEAPGVLAQNKEVRWATVLARLKNS